MNGRYDFGNNGVPSISGGVVEHGDPGPFIAQDATDCHGIGKYSDITDQTPPLPTASCSRPRRWASVRTRVGTTRTATECL